MLLLLVAWSRFLLAVAQPSALSGVSGPRLLATVSWRAAAFIGAAIVGAGAVAATSRVATGRWLGLLPPARAAVAAGLLLVAEHVVLNSTSLFEPVLPAALVAHTGNVVLRRGRYNWWLWRPLFSQRPW